MNTETKSNKPKKQWGDYDSNDEDEKECFVPIIQPQVQYEEQKNESQQPLNNNNKVHLKK